eukprot:TRINITY_DN55291_c0_g1_i1.p2 TRINITY_DN55291_c0_g1~~TRINITY_DN55291_c0_g1_i1.p2  ORF type:complete len:724 (+),score=206.21 TRINITY_DN55291_c0_g1_i1:80-2173(+)
MPPGGMKAADLAEILNPVAPTEDQHRAMMERQARARAEIEALEVPVVSRMGSAYKKICVLGKGSFGSALLCQTAEPGQVVVKVASAPLRDKTQRFNAKRELWAMQRVQHPNVVRLIEVWAEDGAGGEVLHIAMEFCDSKDLQKAIDERNKHPDSVAFKRRVGQLVREAVAALKETDRSDLRYIPNRQWSNLIICGGNPMGGSTDEEALALSRLHAELNQVIEMAYRRALDEGLRPASFPLAQVESWLVQMLWGLHHLHTKARALHRDVKPENMFLTGSGRVLKIGDFGFAGVAATIGGQCVTNLGTPLYQAPEMTGMDPYTDRVDTFGCGVAMYSLLSGSMPWTGVVPGLKFDEHAQVDDPVWGALARTPSRILLRRQICGLSVLPPKLPAELAEPGLFGVVNSMLMKAPGVRPTVGQVLRCQRVRPVARLIIAALHGADPDAFDPFADFEGEAAVCEWPDGGDEDPAPRAGGDAVLGNALNPADRVGCIAGPDGTFRWVTSHPTAEVYHGRGNFTVRVREHMDPESKCVGKMPADGFIEVVEKRKDPATGLVWYRVLGSSGKPVGWCISRLVQEIHGCQAEVFDRVPENQIHRCAREALNSGYGIPCSAAGSRAAVARDLRKAVAELSQRYWDPTTEALGRVEFCCSADDDFPTPDRFSRTAMPDVCTGKPTMMLPPPAMTPDEAYDQGTGCSHFR